MSTARSIVVFVPAEAGTLAADVLGKRAIDYLLENVGRFEDARASIVVAHGAAFAGGSSTIPVHDGTQWQRLRLDGACLIVDARCWFSYAALQGLFARAEEHATGLRVVPGRGEAGTGPCRIETLAMCLASSGNGTNPFRPAATGGAGGIEHLVDAGTYGRAATCEAAALDPGSPPLEIAGYEGIAELERRLLLERAVSAMRQGVRVRDPRSIYIRGKLVCGANVEIEVNVILEGRVVLGDGVTIGANSMVRNSTIGHRTRVNPFSIVEDSSIGCDGFVGPYGRIRPGNNIGDAVQIGNYVEVKNSQVGAGSRVNHHSFIGDSVLGERVTIGAGTITCNYDGVGTNQTVIERDVSIGSGCNLIAPVRIGEGATVGAGSTISQDVPGGKLTLTRSPQTTIEDWRGPRTRRSKE